VHARDAVNRIGGGRVLFDLRGHGPWETLHRLGGESLETADEKARRGHERALAMDRRAVRCADHVVCVSEGLRDYAVEDLGAASSQVDVLPSCTAGPTFDEGDREDARRQWGVGDEPVLIFSGRLAPERLPELMVRSLVAARRIHGEAKLVILSDRGAVTELETHARAAGLPPEAVLTESCDRETAVRRLSGGDVALLFLADLPRFRGIAHPIKTGEYLAAGLPIVVNDTVGFVPSMLERNRCGATVTTDAGLDDFAHRIRPLLTDMDTPHRRSRGFPVRTWEREYSWPAYREVLGRAYGLDSGSAR
jgi:glycosyltransferase involved in cell wall biosynthesis